MSIELVTLVMFGSLIVLLILGVPLVFSMGGIAVGVIYWLYGAKGLLMIVQNTFGQAWTELYIAIPLFIFMGVLLERSGVAEALFESMHRWSGSMRGGLAIGTVGICAIFAAMTGVTATATVTMGLIAVPAMLRRRYDKSLALGTVAGAGTLGVLIPPSIYMILLGLIGRASVGKMFIGGVFPGFLLAFMFAAYIAIRSFFQPDLAPAHAEKFTLREKIISTRALILPMLIILAVIGSIFLGIATPTEASSLGAVGVIIAAAIRRRLNWQVIKESTSTTFRITGMCMWICFGAMCFSAVYTAAGAVIYFNELLAGLEMSRWAILILLMAIIFIMGMFLDPFAIVFIVAPMSFPIILAMGFDLTWYGILFVINMMTGYITPPFGFNLFYLKATAPPDITMGDIYRSIWPFLIIMILGMVLVMLFPNLVLWLPSVMMKVGG